MELHIGMELEIRIYGRWIPFEIFKQGKYHDEIQKWLEITPCNYGMDNNLEHLLILAEALGTDIRHVDGISGIIYKVSFGVGEVTTLASYIWETDQLIKVILTGAMITLEFKPELSHIIEV